MEQEGFWFSGTAYDQAGTQYYSACFFIQKNKLSQKARLIIFICAIIRHVNNFIYCSVLLKG